MSQENLDLVRRGLADVHFFWSLLDDDVVWETTGTPVVGLSPRYVGREAVIDASRQYFGTWTEYRLEAEELIEAGPSVVAVLHERGQGKGSGVPFERLFAQVWTFDEGRVVHWQIFADRAAAFEAAGLSD